MQHYVKNISFFRLFRPPGTGCRKSHIFDVPGRALGHPRGPLGNKGLPNADPGAAPGSKMDSSGHPRVLPGHTRGGPGHQTHAPGHQTDAPGHKNDAPGHKNGATGYIFIHFHSFLNKICVSLLKIYLFGRNAAGILQQE
jgi:hypothetical protein